MNKKYITIVAGKYHVNPVRNGERVYVGSYYSLESAIKARDAFILNGRKIPTEKLNAGIHFIEGKFKPIYQGSVLGSFDDVEEAQKCFESRRQRQCREKSMEKKTISKSMATSINDTVNALVEAITYRIKVTPKSNFNRAKFLNMVIEDINEIKDICQKQS